MKRINGRVLAALSLLLISNLYGYAQNYTVTIDKIEHGSIKIDPQLPAEGKYPAGSVLTVTAVPDKGYQLDAVYYATPGRWDLMYYESMVSPAKITVSSDQHIGASFIDKKEVSHIKVSQDVVYAKPGVKTLKYDVYSPRGAKNLPCVIIIHGGGWSSNTEDIMRGLARELTKGGKFVVFSIDYRWAKKLDGDISGNTMADIIGDVYGAIAHIMEHAAEYGGDPTRIGVTGDSAGGHLSAAAIDMVDRIGDGGFGLKPGIFEFKPTYMPANKRIEQVRDDIRNSIKAAAPSYGVFGGSLLSHYSDDPAADNSWKEAVAPINSIPDVKVRKVPQYLIRGTNDPLIKDADVKAYVDALVKAGQRVEYVQVGGANHAFFDWKPDVNVKNTFSLYGVYYAAEMKAFFISELYKK